MQKTDWSSGAGLPQARHTGSAGSGSSCTYPPQRLQKSDWVSTAGAPHCSHFFAIYYSVQGIMRGCIYSAVIVPVRKHRSGSLKLSHTGGSNHSGNEPRQPCPHSRQSRRVSPSPGILPFRQKKIQCLETMEDCFTVRAFPPLAAAVILIVCV